MMANEMTPRKNPVQRVRELFVSGDLSRLNKTQALVLLAYALHAGANGEAFPSCQTIGKSIGVAAKTVERARRFLVTQRHLVNTHRKPGYGCHAANIYEVPALTRAPEAQPKGTTECPVGEGPRGHLERPLGKSQGDESGGPRGQLVGSKGTKQRGQGDAQMSPKGVKGLRIKDFPLASPAKGASILSTMPTTDKAKPPTQGANKKLVNLAVLAVFKLANVTERDKSRLGKLARDFAQRMPADTDQAAAEACLRKAVNQHRGKWPNATATPESVDKHWAELVKTTPTAKPGLNRLSHGKLAELYQATVAANPNLKGQPRASDAMRRAMTQHLKQSATDQ